MGAALYPRVKVLKRLVQEMCEVLGPALFGAPPDPDVSMRAGSPESQLPQRPSG